MANIQLTVPSNSPGYVNVSASDADGGGTVTTFVFLHVPLSGAWQQVGYGPPIYVSGAQVPVTCPNLRPDLDVTNRPLVAGAFFDGREKWVGRGIWL